MRCDSRGVASAILALCLPVCLVVSLGGSASAQWGAGGWHAGPWQADVYPGWGYGGWGYSTWGYGWQPGVVDGGGWPHGIYYRPRTNEVQYFLPPVYAPAELAYGPQAMKQFMGVDRNFALGPLANPGLLADDPPAAVIARHVEAAAGPVGPPGSRGPSNLEARLSAARFAAYGDSRFRNGEFSAALERYRTAVTLAGDIPEPRLRMAMAQVALGRHDDAVTTLRTAFPLAAAPADRLAPYTKLYADRSIAREQHLESLSRAAFAVADDPTPYFLLGYWFLSEGDATRAEKFLRQAALLGGNAGPLAQSLLETPAGS